MPQGSNQQGSKKKKKGRAPAHQNSFAFKHNPKSKLTEKILSSPNVGTCRRCYEKIEWRKKYRKYKPLTQPKTCNKCQKRNIKAAYHTVCDDCSYQTVSISSSTSTSNSSPEIENDQKESNNEQKKQKVIRMCSVCAKEPAMSTKTLDEINEEEEETLKAELTQQMLDTSSLDRLTLREKKAIERKVEQQRQQQHEQSL